MKIRKDASCIIVTNRNSFTRLVRNIAMAAFLSLENNYLVKGLDISYRIRGGVYMSNGIGNNSKVKIGTIVDLQFADASVVVAFSTT